MRGNEHFHFQGPSSELEVQRLVHDTFSRALSPAARKAYDGITPFEAYVCRIARNLMINEAARARTTPQPTLTGELPDLETLTATPEELVEQGELQALVREFLESRPEEERRIYASRFKDGDSQEVTASRLGAARITVRRAESRLKTAFLRFLLRKQVVSPQAAARALEKSHEP